MRRPPTLPSHNVSLAGVRRRLHATGAGGHLIVGVDAAIAVPI
jgi:hypothetical protein